MCLCLFSGITRPFWSSKLHKAAHRWEEEKKSPAQHKYYSEFLGSISLMLMELLFWIFASTQFLHQHHHHLSSLFFLCSLSLSLPLTSEQVLICREYYCPVPTFAGAVAAYGNRGQLQFDWLTEDVPALKSLPSLTCLNIHAHTHTPCCPWHSRLSGGILQQVQSDSF